MPPSAVHAPAVRPPHPVGQLSNVVGAQGLFDLAARLAELDRWIGAELREFERDLETVPQGVRAVQAAAHHLLDLGGKHLRPMCVALASKVGEGFGPHARQLAVAVELVHTATLLHDDVVDIAATRRGEPTARTIYGNAASIFAGDWLLVDALRRIRGTGYGDLLDEMLAIIEEMILAESLQLERRGQVNGDVADYFRVAEGKTAALFRWAMRAGARAGGCSPDVARGLERFGLELGVGFQIVDDCLDFAGDAAVTGKALYTDLREGKLTYPVLLGLERDPALEALVAEAIERADAPAGELVAQHRAIAERIHGCGALADARRAATDRIGRAVTALAVVPEGAGKAALTTVAEATATREK
jgi:octaprenyl-diphosphate synthase